jgi:parvulin-like peptidyl-prolyl isomerase
MLSFLRNNSIKIVYGIIIAFIVTTFMGVVFFNDSFQSSKNIEQRQLDRQSAVALIGEAPVSMQMFLLENRRLISQLPENVQLNNNTSEMIQLNALNKAIENTLLLEMGLSQKIKATRSEINAALYSVMDQFGVSNKKELKFKMAEVGGSYESMLYQLKNDIIASKLQRALLSSIEINDLDKSHMATQFEINDIFISNRTTQNVEIEDEDLYAKAMAIRANISNSESFKSELKAVLTERGEAIPKIQSKRLTINQVIPDLARAIYSINPGEISQPIRTLNGYFIIELKNKSELPVTQQITEDMLQKNWERQVFYGYLYHQQAGREIKIIDPSLNALKLKNEGRLSEAIDAYQGVISQDPSNPYPNLLIAQLYLMLGDIANAKQILLKGEIKESLIDAFIPEIHVLLAEIYNQEKFSTKRDQQFDKLLASDIDNINLLNYLKDTFKKSNDTLRLTLVNEQIEALSSTKDIIEDAANLTKDLDSDFLNEVNQN